jgi:hypothetical protein
MSKQLSTLFMRLVGIKIRDTRKEDFKFSVFSGGLLFLQLRCQFPSCSVSRHDLGGSAGSQRHQLAGHEGSDVDGLSNLERGIHILSPRNMVLGQYPFRNCF